ncbi:MAG: methylmalonyl-CoA epimerase [Sphingobacteriales bacterium]|nr:MAG: methylmalonyl-CoA epimerase [Sphingobacteriales bacterium]
MNKIEHIGIAVKDLESAINNYTILLGAPCYKREFVESEQVETAFFKTGENKIELLQATHPASAIARFIEKKGEGIHHIAFDVINIHAHMERLRGEGYTLLNEAPKRGADNKMICFVHPRETNGTLIELCEEISPESTVQSLV